MLAYIFLTLTTIQTVATIKDGEQWDGELTARKARKARLTRLQEVLVEGEDPVTAE